MLKTAALLFSVSIPVSLLSLMGVTGCEWRLEFGDESCTENKTIDLRYISINRSINQSINQSIN